MANDVIYRCSPDQKFICGVCNAEFASVAKMASHIKTKKNSDCSKASDSRPTRAPRNKATLETIRYVHSVTKLGCKMCDNYTRYGLVITSLQPHFKNYCELVHPERREKVMKRDRCYNNKRFAKKRKGESEKKSVKQSEEESEEEAEEKSEEEAEETSEEETVTDEPEEESEEESENGTMLCQKCRGRIHNEQHFLRSAKCCRRCISNQLPSEIGEQYDNKGYRGLPPIKRRLVNVLFAEDKSKFAWYRGRVQSPKEDKYTITFDDDTVEEYEYHETPKMMSLIWYYTANYY